MCSLVKNEMALCQCRSRDRLLVDHEKRSADSASISEDLELSVADVADERDLVMQIASCGAARTTELTRCLGSRCTPTHTPLTKTFVAFGYLRGSYSSSTSILR